VRRNRERTFGFFATVMIAFRIWGRSNPVFAAVTTSTIASLLS
jgi:hypothetical protein